MRGCNLFAVPVLFAAITGLFAQDMPRKPRPSVNINYSKVDFPVSNVANKMWNSADTIMIDRYWSGAKSPEGRRASASLLWSRTALYVRFTARQAEPLVVAEKPQTASKTLNLWDRDVAEIFVAPDSSQPKKYFEFEVAPTGEWIDVALDLTTGTRVSDWAYASGMEAFARIEANRVVIAMRIPWSAFGKTPKAGDVWLGNLFRCVGKDPDRGYLAWNPTGTKEPSFHVPEAFGEFRFVD